MKEAIQLDITYDQSAFFGTKITCSAKNLAK